MAFNLGDRFLPPPKYFKLLDPGAYNSFIKPQSKSNYSKTPFLSKTPRNTQPGTKIWTHTLYYADYPPKIQNCTSFMSKRPRFPYEIYSKGDLDELLCKCGNENPCECSVEKAKVVCQGKIRKHLFKGHPPRSNLGEGLSTPSKTDHGFKVLLDGKIIRLQDKILCDSPPFYDTNVNESSSFYRGCKWSKWTSERSREILNTNPGPAQYTLKREPTTDEICSEKLRSYRRQTSKQFRFIEIVQQRDILENRPGPANYSPQLPKGFQLKYVGQKSDRFSKQKCDTKPGPADHWIRRDFEPIEFSGHISHAKLPKPSCFGVKALRFRPRKEEGPSPASYYSKFTLCNHITCSSAPFGSNSKRFKSTQLEEWLSDEENDVENNNNKNVINEETRTCILPTWQFRSETLRMQKLVKRLSEPSPADLPQTKAWMERPQELQYMAPFSSTESRFQPWYNWIPVHGKLHTPGPCSYNLQIPKCYPAVHRGPVFRAKRFLPPKYNTPAPNEYDVGGNIESILKTNNIRLQYKVDNKHKYTWKPPPEQRKPSIEEQENLLLKKTIALLDTKSSEEKDSKQCNNETNELAEESGNKRKLLRCFLYNKQMTCY